MRLGMILLALSAGGCQVVFPLTEITQPDAADPFEKPQVEIKVAGDFVVAPAPTEIALQIGGHGNAQVAYEAVVSEGALATNAGVANLSSTGIVVEPLQWTPPDQVAAVTIAVTSGYEVVDDSNQVTSMVSVAKRFGRQDAESFTGLPDPTTVLAMPISISPTGGHAIKLGAVVVAGTGTPTQAMLALYSNLNNKPRVLLASTQPFAVPPMGSPARVESDVALVDVAPGTYWLAVVFDHDGAVGSAIAPGIDSLFGDTTGFAFPDPFPTSTVVTAGQSALDVLVVP